MSVALHILHVVDGETQQFWLCDQRGGRLLKVQTTRRAVAIDAWMQEHHNAALAQLVTYRTPRSPDEAATIIAALLRGRVRTF